MTKNYKSIMLYGLLAMFGWWVGTSIFGRFGWRPAPSTGNQESFAWGVVPPAMDLYQLVKEADIIIVGTIDSVADQGDYAGYDEEDNLIPFETSTPGSAPGTPTAAPEFSLPYSDFVVSVQDLIKNDGGTGDRTVRMITDGPQPKSTACAPTEAIFPPGDINETYMFFLKTNPDGTYGLYRSPNDRIILGEEITYSDCSETAVDFATGMDEEDFVSAVETQVAAPTRTPTATATSTPTPTVSPTPTSTATPTPCFGPGC